MRRTCAAVFAATWVIGLGPALAQDNANEEDTLGELMVTAQRHAENVQRVPISVSTVDGEKLANFTEGGDDIRALAARVPSLYAESSNGRLAPRFYIRGLGNSDFDLAASQPVSIIVDEVVLENVILKSFPLFDIDHVEVLRGPQGTLFGRNTPAGIVKFDTKKPTKDFQADFSASYGELDSGSITGAVSGGTDTVQARLSVLYQTRGDWISNDFTGEEDAMGGFNEFAWRGQLQFTPSDSFKALLNIHGRDNDGTASIFRANVLGPGSDGFNSNYDRDTVIFDSGNNNPQEAKGLGGSVRLEWDMPSSVTLTSISAYETTDDKSLGDIDGGFGAGPAPGAGPCPPGSAPGATCIPFPSTTQDGIDDLDQITQEIRIAAQASDRTFWQAGAFYFDSKFTVTTNPFFVPATTVEHKNKAWAAFGHLSYDLTDALTMTFGARWTDDDKDFRVISTPFTTTPETFDRSASDTKLSWDVSALFTVSDAVNVYGRLASGFRAPTIQGRDVAFGSPDAPSVADSETITSVEAGIKTLLAGNRVRLNGSVFYYRIKDQQLSAIGGAGNNVILVNADKGVGKGFDVDAEFLVTENFLLNAGFSWVDTELQDDNLRVAPCGSGMCTVTDPIDTDGFAIVDGNSFAQAPEYIATIAARYGMPVGTNGEFFFSTDWAFQGKTHFFIYDATEFQTDSTFEGGARVGYSHNGGQWEVALFGRNITDEENVKGAIDFNNLTGFDNEPRILGVSFSAHFR